MPAKRQRPTSKAPVKDEALSGSVEWSPDYLRKNEDKRRELLDSPDGTPGKDVAEAVELELRRDAEAAPLVREGAKLARKWDKLRGQEAGATRDLAEVLFKLRQLYVVGPEERVDLIGRSTGYREASAEIYRKAGLDDKATEHVQSAVRHQVQEMYYKRLRETAAGNERKYLALCDYYGVNPLSPNERRRKGASNVATLPAAKLRTDQPAKLYAGVVKYISAALDVPTAPATGLSADERERLRGEFAAAQARLAALAAALADDEADADG